VIASGLSGCGADNKDAVRQETPSMGDPGPIHVHGLGLNPRDGTLFIATHTGLFRVAPGESSATRVGDRFQDTMGFTVVGPDRFLGSGHPDGRDNLPPFLGLIESRDAGRSWKPISLLGKADFHVLEARGGLIYGYGSDFETRQSRFLVSAQGGKSWEERRVPEPLISLALHPRDPRRLVAAGQRGIYESRDGGRHWERRGSEPGLLVWQGPERLVLVTATGEVKSSRDGGSWAEVGQLGGQPAAFEAEADGLYAALHDGTIKRSTDGGRSWNVRSRP
jgi:hypothetical protein